MYDMQNLANIFATFRRPREPRPAARSLRGRGYTGGATIPATGSGEPSRAGEGAADAPGGEGRSELDVDENEILLGS